MPSLQAELPAPIIIPRLLLQLVSLALLACAAWLLWRWWDGYDVVSTSGVVVDHVHGSAWWLWTGVGLLAWSFGAGRLVVLALIPGGHAPSSQIAMRLVGFGRHATRGQVDLTMRLSAKGSPAVQAKGNLAMLAWKVTESLPGITVPALVLTGDRDIVTPPGGEPYDC